VDAAPRAGHPRFGESASSSPVARPLCVAVLTRPGGRAYLPSAGRSRSATSALMDELEGAPVYGPVGLAPALLGRRTDGPRGAWTPRRPPWPRPCPAITSGAAKLRPLAVTALAVDLVPGTDSEPGRHAAWRRCFICAAPPTSWLHAAPDHVFHQECQSLRASTRRPAAGLARSVWRAIRRGGPAASPPGYDGVDDHGIGA